jgi:phage-related protein
MIYQNQIYGYAATVQCDAPWGWTSNISKTYTYNANVNRTEKISIVSGNNYYLYPQLEFQMTNAGGDFTLTNISDNSRVFLFTGLKSSEKITVDNDRGIVTSSTLLNVMSKFNKNLFRFISGVNSINIKGNVSYVKFTYKLAKKSGG